MSDVLWALFVETRDREDVPNEVRRDIGGAVKRLMPTRYRRFNERRQMESSPAAATRIKAQRERSLKDWRDRHPELVREYNNRAARKWQAAHPDTWAGYQRAYYEANRERILEQHRKRYWLLRGEAEPRPRNQRPKMSPEEQKASNQAAVRRYKERIGKEVLAQRQRERRAREQGAIRD